MQAFPVSIDGIFICTVPYRTEEYKFEINRGKYV